MEIRVRIPHTGRRASPDFVLSWSMAAEQLGYDSLWGVDHIVMPQHVESAYVLPRTPIKIADDGVSDLLAPNFELVTTLAFVAAVTERIRLGTAVAVLPIRNAVLNPILIGGHSDAALERAARLGDDHQIVERIEAILVDRLVLRLRIEAWYAANGDEASQPVENLLVVFGLPRTATTAVHHLLSSDPRFRYLRSWEVSDPVPPPRIGEEDHDPRRPAERPPSNVRHIVSIDGPAEDWPIHALDFDHAELTLPLPSYSAWWRNRQHRTLFGYHERVLRLLHSRRPPRQWLLKMPAYVFLLQELDAAYPRARFVMTHRDPVTAIASTCSTIAAAREKRTPTWTPSPRFGRDQLEHWEIGMARALAAREQLGDDRFVDIAQHQVERDAVGVAERIYDTAGLSLEGSTADAMAKWAARNSRGSRGEHRYRLEDYGLTAAEVRARFAPYLERFGHLCSAR